MDRSDYLRCQSLTMKWSERTAQWLQPWVTRGVRSALKVAAGLCVEAIGLLIRRVVPSIGCHFQGMIHNQLTPGLKSWAVLSNHFMVQNRSLGKFKR
jgi:hypothetical protein